MNAILKIYFFGLIAFVEQRDPHRLLALLVDANGQYVTADGSGVPAHTALLVARADHCKGDCHLEDDQIAQQVFPTAREPDRENLRSQLKSALQGGGGWVLNDLDVTLSAPDGMPNPTPTLQVLRDPETLRQDTTRQSLRLPAGGSNLSSFDWVVNLTKFAPGALEIDPRLLANNPPAALIASRINVAQGAVKAYRLADDANRVIPFHLESLTPPTATSTSSDSPTPGGAQAMAIGVVVEIQLPGCSVELSARALDSDPDRKDRSMVLSTGDCKNGQEIEIAVLNLPAHETDDAANARASSLAEDRVVDRHFEIYYELARCRPARGERPVPVFRRSAKSPSWLTPAESWPSSDFLETIGLPGRGLSGHAICIPVQFETGG